MAYTSGPSSLAERAQRYRSLSLKAVETADRMPTEELREGYMRLARDWEALAREAERAADDGCEGNA